MFIFKMGLEEVEAGSGLGEEGRVGKEGFRLLQLLVCFSSEQSLIQLLQNFFIFGNWHFNSKKKCSNLANCKFPFPFPLKHFNISKTAFELCKDLVELKLWRNRVKSAASCC